MQREFHECAGLRVANILKYVGPTWFGPQKKLVGFPDWLSFSEEIEVTDLLIPWNIMSEGNLFGE